MPDADNCGRRYRYRYRYRTDTDTAEMRVQKLSEQRYIEPSALFMVLFATIRSNSATGIGVREGKCPGDVIRCGCSLFSGKA